MNNFIIFLKHIWHTAKLVFFDKRGEAKLDEWWKDKDGNTYLRIGKKNLKISTHHSGTQSVGQKIIRLIERELSK